MNNMHISGIRFSTAWFAVLAVSLASLVLIACAHGAAAQPDTVAATALATSKVSPLLDSVARQLMAGHSASEFRDGLVRADSQGRLQVYVYIDSSSSENLATLVGRGLVKAMPSPALHLVQGWLRPQDLGAIAGLPFVTRITPPRYAQPR